jgi:hypothetical protein
MSHQLPLDLPASASVMEEAGLAGASAGERGAIFTRREVVDFILDLVGYTEDAPLHEYRLLEPSCGHGDFLLPAVERLLRSAQRNQIAPTALSHCITATEVHPESIAETGIRLGSLLAECGISPADTSVLLDHWLIKGDFLLADIRGAFSHVVGNPPYLRPESIPPRLMAEYRARYTTIFDRADLYIPFFERGLKLLAPSGKLGFICSDRWMKNRYGAPLRAMVARDYHLACYIDMVDTPAFTEEVIAYPAITVIERASGVITKIAHRPEINATALAMLARNLTETHVSAQASPTCIEAEAIAQGSEPWVLDAPEQTALVRRLEATFPTLAEAGCTVGIGVATGADQVFIGRDDQLDVEPERKLPLVTTRDIASGEIRWQGKMVLNPFEADGSLAEIERYPRFSAYLAAHADTIRKRHVARNNPHAWYRTIDKIDYRLTATPKLLIPDIKGEAHVVLDNGDYYPHHNLYYITSSDWPLPVLQAVLRSGIGTLFVATYSVKMRGGHLRFQAQYLRRIRIPRWHDLPVDLRNRISEAIGQGNSIAYRSYIYDAYRLTADERKLITPQQET